MPATRSKSFRAERSPAQESDEKLGRLASIVVLHLKEWGDRLTAWEIEVSLQVEVMRSFSHPFLDTGHKKAEEIGLIY